MRAKYVFLGDGARSLLSGFLLLFVLAAGFPPGAAASELLSTFLDEVPAAQLAPDADAYGEIGGTPPAAEILKDGRLAGYAFLTTDFVNAVGYSGKPIRVLLGMDLDGTITGARLVEHHEPIVLIGIPEKRIRAFIQGFVGREIAADAVSAEEDEQDLDIIAGATVTVMVMDDSIRRAALKLARSRGLAGLSDDEATGPRYALAEGEPEVRDWKDLMAEGSIARMRLTVGEVSAAFEAAGHGEAAARPESENPSDTFIDLYAAPVSIPTIGLSLLGEREYALLRKRLKDGQHAILVMGRGLYSFKGSGYVRGGIFDRLQLVQGEASVRFRDRQHRRIAAVAAAEAPEFKELALFYIPERVGFDIAAPWRLKLLVQRQTGARDKAFTIFGLDYETPGTYLRTVTPPASGPVAAAAEERAARQSLWQKVWMQKLPSIITLFGLLGILTLIFFFQDWLVKRPVLTARIRYAYLTVVLFWLGFYSDAQLSVVNVFTFTNALITDFDWGYFLMAPLIFILWVGVAVGMLFWGRGSFCGWLCPYGALQELTNKLARWAGVRQVILPWGLNERLWPVKYIAFLLLFGVSLHSLSLAERLAEIEPFKTAIIMDFQRAWPFVVVAAAPILINLFIERFFCRYLCPLGAALAIPARIRMFDWLKRYRECGHPCQRCANICPTAAIHPDGHINVNECIYCLDCQKLYYDDHRCPPMIQKRLRHERQLLAASDSTLTPAQRAEKERLRAQRENRPRVAESADKPEEGGDYVE